MDVRDDRAFAGVAPSGGRCDGSQGQRPEDASGRTKARAGAGPRPWESLRPDEDRCLRPVASRVEPSGPPRPPPRSGLAVGAVRDAGPVQVALVACGYAAAISSNVMTVPNFEACEPYSGSFDALHSSTVAAAECGRTAFGADLTQHSARVA